MSATILMVDDHAGFRERARVLLEAEGYDVVGEAADGQSGIEAARRLRPDLALVDIGLPDLDGFAVAASMRASGTAGLIVLISGRDREDFGDRVARSEADGFIAKRDLSAEHLARFLRS